MLFSFEVFDSVQFNRLKIHINSAQKSLKVVPRFAIAGPCQQQWKGNSRRARSLSAFMAHSSDTHPALTTMALCMLEAAHLSRFLTISLCYPVLGEPAEDCVSVLHSYRNEKIRSYFRVTCLTSEKKKCKTHLKIVKQASKNKRPQIVSSHLTVKESAIRAGNKGSQS